jgi:hypothetical protein
VDFFQSRLRGRAVLVRREHLLVIRQGVGILRRVKWPASNAFAAFFSSAAIALVGGATGGAGAVAALAGAAGTGLSGVFDGGVSDIAGTAAESTAGAGATGTNELPG